MDEASAAASDAEAAAIGSRPAGIAASPSAQPAHARARCANCGAPLAGPYCSECGQRHQYEPVHHFWHFLSEATEDLTHADSRLWQTLIALLFRPGFLTREFLEGRRVRYLPPVRLYLVVSVIFFVIVGLDSQIANSSVVLSYNGHSFHYHVNHSAAAGTLRAGTGLAAIAPTPAARQRVCEQSGNYIEQHGGWFAALGPRVRQSCLAALAQGGLQRVNQAVEHNLERAMFLFLPLLALVMKPLYLKPPRHYVEHLLFLLHNHAFLFVMLGLSALLKMSTSSAIVLGPVDTAIAIYVPIYFYLAMRRVYGQGRWLTLSKLGALGSAYFFLGLVMWLATLSYSFLML
jgi:hypothetical protein